MTIDQLNRLNETKAYEAFEQCCGASRWVDRMIVGRPYEDLNELLEISDRVWEECDVEDYQEAFSHHVAPRDGQSDPWMMGDIKSMNNDPDLANALSEANRLYEEKFGHVFICCAIGKGPAELLSSLQARIKNDPEKEIMIAAEEQNKITRHRLKRLLHTASDTISIH